MSFSSLLRVTMLIISTALCASFLAGSVLSLAAADQSTALPDLPRVSFENFLPAVRGELDKAYAAAIANPKDAAANGRLGMILQAHSLLEAAEACYLRARLLEPTSFRWAYYLGFVQAAQGRYDEGATTLRQALRLDPNYVPAKLKLGEFLIAMGQWEESSKLYSAILQEQPGNASAHYGLGRVRAARKDWSRAVVSYRRACELFPDFGAAHYALALAYRNLGQMDKSQREFQLYERNKTAVPPAGDRLRDEIRGLEADAISQVRRGTELERGGELEQAAAAHEKALEIDPQMVEAHVNLISLYGRLGQLERAEEHYRAAVRINPNQPEAYYDYGVLLFDARKYSQAEDAFRKALEINPFHPEAHNNLAYLLEQQGKVGEAIDHYRKAIENKPDYRLAHFHLGRVLVNQRNYQEGIQHLLKTLQPEDDSTPGYLYALGAAYGRASDWQNALLYLRMAREQASRRGQSKLLAGIEKDLRTLEDRVGNR